MLQPDERGKVTPAGMLVLNTGATEIPSSPGHLPVPSSEKYFLNQSNSL